MCWLLCSMMSVSLANTLRATEPVVAVVLLYYSGWRNGDGIQWSYVLRDVIAVAPIVCGAMLAAFGNSNSSVAGIMLCLVANICFCMRTRLYKQIKQMSYAANGRQLSDLSAFTHMCSRGAVVQFLVVLVCDGKHAIIETASSLCRWKAFGLVSSMVCCRRRPGCCCLFSISRAKC